MRRREQESKNSVLVAEVRSKVEEVVKAVVKDELLELLQGVQSFERVTTTSIADLRNQMNDLKEEIRGISKLIGRMLKNEGSEIEKSKKDLSLEGIESLKKVINHLSKSVDRMKDETSQLSKRFIDGEIKTANPSDTVAVRNVPQDVPKVEQENMPVAVAIPPATKIDEEKCEMAIKKLFKEWRKTSVFSENENKEEKIKEIVEQEEYNGNAENCPIPILNIIKKHNPIKDIQHESDEIGTDEQSLRTKASKVSMQLAEILGDVGSVSEQNSQFEEYTKPYELSPKRVSFSANIGQHAAVTALKEAAALLAGKNCGDDILSRRDSSNSLDDRSLSEESESSMAIEVDERTSKSRGSAASIKLANLLLRATKMTNPERTYHDKFTPTRQGSGLSTPGRMSRVNSIVSEVSLTVNELMRIQNVQNRGDDETSANDDDFTTAPVLQSEGSVKSLQIESILADMVIGCHQ